MCKGLFTALVTPFNSSGELDEKGMRENIRFQYANGVDGIAVLGTTGEAVTLTQEERERVIELAREEAPEGTLIVGTGTNSTQQTIANTIAAANFGADYALVICPYYNKPMQEGIYQHFATVAAHSPIPLILYNNPGRTGQNMEVETIARLAELPQIIGVKETSGQMIPAAEIIRLQKTLPKEFALIAGDEYMVFPLMTLGATALISPTANVIPRTMRLLINYLQNKEWEPARMLYLDLLPLFRLLFCETNPIPIKAAMNHWGIAAGPCRLPLTSLSNANQERLLACLQRWEVENRSAFESVI